MWKYYSFSFYSMDFNYPVAQGIFFSSKKIASSGI